MANEILDNTVATKAELQAIEELSITREQFLNEETLKMPYVKYFIIWGIVFAVSIHGLLLVLFSNNRFPDDIKLFSFEGFKYGFNNLLGFRLTIGSFVIGIITMVIFLISCKFKFNRVMDAKEANVERIPRIKDAIENKIQMLQSSSIVPFDYLNLDAVSRFEQYLLSNKANSIEECIELYSKEG